MSTLTDEPFGWLILDSHWGSEDFTRYKPMGKDLDHDIIPLYTRPHSVAPAIPEGYALVPIEPTKTQWGFLARDIILWMEMDRPTPEKLFKHLKMLGREIPNWLINEHEMKNMGAVPSKGTRAVLIYKAMLELEAAKEAK